MEIALEAFGLGDKERRFYVAALELGCAPVSAVAARAGIARTQGYDVFARLQERGLLSQMESAEGRMVAAEDPRHLLAEHDRARDRIAEVMPMLQSLYADSSRKPRFRVYDGVEGIQRAMTEALDCPSRQLRGILSMRSLALVPGLQFMDQFIADRLRRAVHLDVIRARSSETDAIWPASDAERRALRFAPGEMDLKMTMFVADTRVVYVSSQKENYGIVIDSLELAEFQRSQFDFLWAQCEAGEG
ncbi:TrmB family transcriptional regulator [Pseudooceanicola sp. C21-150M6]|uniref:TrmB family transcriptional regulator n=1 Tax=Pseudooceanicola sp. C21-150M6 TaxID=3434355 RepID=UPI003D7FACAE